MATESLPLKYRPLAFEQLVGQETTARHLAALIRRGQIGKNIILAGGYGSGKTTSGRIYGRALNCERPTETGSPCNVCKQCVDQLEGRHPDYSEYDAASNSKVEQIREFLQVANSPPMLGKFRILLLDEAHALSKQAWDVLLKIVEEPPPYLVFIFATTEADKVRKAIASRCQVLQVKTLDHKTSIAHLRHICDQEGLQYEQEALEIISHVSHGHTRDLLKHLEQVTVLSDAVTAEAARLAFHIGDVLNVLRYYDAILSNRPDEAILVTEFWNESPSTILDVVRNYAVHSYHRHHRGTTLSVDRMLDLLPAGNTKRVHDQWVATAQAAGVEPEAAYMSYMKYLATARAETNANLNLHTMLLTDLVHRRGFGETSGQTAQRQISSGPAGSTVAPRREGRRWTTVPNQDPGPQAAPAPPPQEPPKATESPTAPQVFPHSLSQFGFAPTDSTKVRSL